MKTFTFGSNKAKTQTLGISGSPRKPLGLDSRSKWKGNPIMESSYRYPWGSDEHKALLMQEQKKARLAAQTEE